MMGSISGLRQHWPDSPNAWSGAAESLLAMDDPAPSSTRRSRTAEAIRRRSDDPVTHVRLGVGLEPPRASSTNRLPPSGSHPPRHRSRRGSCEHRRFPRPEGSLRRGHRGLPQSGCVGDPRSRVAHDDLRAALMNESAGRRSHRRPTAGASVQPEPRQSPRQPRHRLTQGGSSRRPSPRSAGRSSSIELGPAHVTTRERARAERSRERSHRVLSRSARLGPEDADAHYGLGIELAKKGLRTTPSPPSREAARIEPEHAESPLQPRSGSGLGQRSVSRVARQENRKAAATSWDRGDATGAIHPRRGSRTLGAVVDEEQDFESRLTGHLAAGTMPEDEADLVALARTGLDQGHPADRCALVSDGLPGVARAR